MVNDTAGGKEQTPMTPQQLIFVSHASHDAPLAQAFVDTLILGGVGRDAIFFSSERGMGVPAGSNVDDVLRSSLSGASLVIELITPTFLTRPVCLMELGGAWAKRTPTFPIVVPPLTYLDVTTAIGNFQMTSWSDDTAVRRCFAELQDFIPVHAGVTVRSSHWHSAVNGFAARLPTLLAAAAPPSTPTGNSKSLPPPTAATAPSSTHKGIAFGPPSVTRDRGRSRLHVEATNLTDQAKTAIVKVTYYDQNGGIVDTSSASLSGIEPGATETLTFLNVPTFDRLKFDVGSIL